MRQTFYTYLRDFSSYHSSEERFTRFGKFGNREELLKLLVLTELLIKDSFKNIHARTRIVARFVVKSLESVKDVRDYM